MGGRFWLLLAGFLASSLGTWIYRLALPLLVYDLTGSALGTGLVYVMEYVPYLLLGMVGGVLADRFPRRRVLVLGDLAAGLVTLVLAVTLMLQVRQLWVVYLLALVLASVDPLYQPAFRAIVPSLVPLDRLPQANARVHMGEHAVTMVGPVAGGALVVSFGYEVAIYTDAATFLVSALLVALIGRVPQAAPVRGASVVADIREGLRFLRVDKAVLTSGLIALACNFGVWLLLANLVFYLSSYHRFTPGEIGVVYAFQGAGAVVGAILGGRLIRRHPPWRVICWSITAAGLAMLLMIWARGPVLIGLAWMGQFAGAAAMVVAIATVRQWLVPDRLLGRVLGTLRMIAFASIPLASLATGVFETVVRDAYVLMAFAGVSWLVIAAGAALSPLRRVTPPAAVAGRSARPAACPPPDRD